MKILLPTIMYFFLNTSTFGQCKIWVDNPNNTNEQISVTTSCTKKKEPCKCYYRKSYLQHPQRFGLLQAPYTDPYESLCYSDSHLAFNGVVYAIQNITNNDSSEIFHLLYEYKNEEFTVSIKRIMLSMVECDDININKEIECNEHTLIIANGNEFPQIKDSKTFFITGWQFNADILYKGNWVKPSAFVSDWVKSLTIFDKN